MKSNGPSCGIGRRALLKTIAAFPALSAPLFSVSAQAAGDPLPSWNEGPAKQAIIDFVRTTTAEGGSNFVRQADRIAEFDQDGTLWVEHPLYTQVVYCLDRVGVLATEKPELKDREPFKAVLSRDREAIAKLTLRDLLEIVLATQSGMTQGEMQLPVNEHFAMQTIVPNIGIEERRWC